MTNYLFTTRCPDYRRFNGIAGSLFGYYFIYEVSRYLVLRSIFDSIISGIIGVILSPINYNLKADVRDFRFVKFSVLLIAGVILSLQRFRPAYFFTAAWSVVIILNLHRILSLIGVFPSSLFTEGV